MPQEPNQKAIDFETRRNRRFIPFYVATLAAGAILMGNLAREQLFLREQYLEQEKIQTMRRIILPGPRGNIFDRNGTLLVGNQARFSASVYLNELRAAFRREYIARVREIRRDLDETARIDVNDLIWESRLAVVRRLLDDVNRTLGREETITRQDVERHFTNRVLLPLPLIRDLSEEEYARLIDQLPAESPIVVHSESARFYPYGPLAAHTLGYVISDPESPNDELPGGDLMTFSHMGKTGKSGLERAFDELLDGHTGTELWRVDPMGFQYERVSFHRPSVGQDLVTSLDVDVQMAAEEALEGLKGAAVALDPVSGEVLAIASVPAYDLNDFSPFISSETYREIDTSGAWLNRAHQGLYPPGSTFKPVTAVAALANGAIEPDEILFCGGSYRVGNRLFPEHTPGGFGEIQLPRALAVSSNVYFYQAGVRTGIKEIARFARLFGLDEPTGIEIPFEASGMIVPDPEWKRANRDQSWFPGDTANTAIGQGFLQVTPLQMATLAASLSRGETRTRPTLVHGEDRFRTDHGADPIPLPREEYDAVIEGMVRAVREGTARRAGIPGVQVAGKTGTAQVFPDGVPLTLAWFIGFAPVEAPEIAVAVMIEGVSEADQFQGGLTAAPVAREIFAAYFKDRAREQLASAPR